MRKAYAITVVSSLLQALVCGVLFTWLGGRAIMVAALLTLGSVWLGFFYASLAMRRNRTPTAPLAMGTGAVLGAFCAITFCLISQIDPFAFSGFLIFACAIGAVVGSVLGFLNLTL